MMNLLLDNRGLLLAIGKEINFGTYDEMEKWKVDNYYMIDANYELVEDVEVPIEVIPQKYFYINGTFIINPNYIDEGKLSREIAEINSQLALATESNVENDYRLCTLELGMH